LVNTVTRIKRQCSITNLEINLWLKLIQRGRPKLVKIIQFNHSCLHVISSLANAKLLSSEILMVVIMKNTVYWDVTPYNFFECVIYCCCQLL